MNETEICNKCGLILTPNDHVMEITTEQERTFYFCARCVKFGYMELDSKPNKTPADVHLMMGLKNFLKNHKQIAIS